VTVMLLAVQRERKREKGRERERERERRGEREPDRDRERRDAGELALCKSQFPHKCADRADGSADVSLPLSDREREGEIDR